jgi:DNA adenine methylase
MKPIIKWAGGKRQLLPVLLNNLPNKYNGAYYEPFFGGGALFFELAPKVSHINDINEDLIGLYKVFFQKEELHELIKLLDKHEKNHSKDYYYLVRSQDRNKNYTSNSRVFKAARLIYLNKSCFNGLYRVNSKGYFNVPFNNNKKVNLYEKENFLEINDFFSKNTIHISSLNYIESLKGIKKGDFVYFDPPYDDLADKKSFTSYSKFGFEKENQIQLANLFKELSKKGVYCMLSNHDTELIKTLYSEFKIVKVKAQRLINSNVNGRKSINEVLVKNYL